MDLRALLERVRSLLWGRRRELPLLESTALTPAPLDVAPLDFGPAEVAVAAAAPEPAKERKEHDFTYHYLRGDVASAAMKILNRLENLSNYKSDDDRAERLRVLEQLWGCDFLLFDREIGERMKGGDRWTTVSATQEEHAELSWPVDFAVASFTPKMSYSEEAEKTDLLSLMRLRSISMREARGRVTRVAKRMLHVSIAQVAEGGWWDTADTVVGLTGDKWVRIAAGHNTSAAASYNNWVDQAVRSVVPSILTARYEWHVALGTIKGGPRVLLPTNPAQCLKLFKNRDVDGGKSRREKLRHWVEEHWRDKEEVGLAYVCAHLRGHTKFTWAGFDCELFPSAFDLEKCEEFKKQAAEWRSRRQHNQSVRVHLKKREQV